MVCCIKVLATKPDNVSFITWWKIKNDSHSLSSHRNMHIYTYTQIDKYNLKYRCIRGSVIKATYWVYRDLNLSLRKHLWQHLCLAPGEPDASALRRNLHLCKRTLTQTLKHIHN